jgi:hypothetical protein
MQLEKEICSAEIAGGFTSSLAVAGISSVDIQQLARRELIRRVMTRGAGELPGRPGPGVI